MGPELASIPCSHDLIPSDKYEAVSESSSKLRGMIRKFVVRLCPGDGYEGMTEFIVTNREHVVRRTSIEVMRGYKERILLFDQSINLKVLRCKKRAIATSSSNW